MSKEQWVVYLVSCADGSLYCGVTKDLKRRLAAHNAGQGAKYTRSRLPIRLVCVSPKMAKHDAFKLEYRIKRLPAHRKPMAVALARSGQANRSPKPSMA